MKLYRTFTKDPSDEFAVFHDAVASLRQAMRNASQLQAAQPVADIWIDEENWPTLSLLQYYWYRALGVHEGFGVSFQYKHRHRFSESRAVWPEKAVLKAHAQDYIANLEPASEFVLIASPRYSGKYRCEVVVRSRILLSQAALLRDSTFGGGAAEVLARAALPLWLERAQPGARSPSILPPPFFALLDPYNGNFIAKGEASVFCLDCGQTVSDIRTGVRNEQSLGNRGEWTSSWRCPVGHNMYSEDHDARLILRPR